MAITVVNSNNRLTDASSTTGWGSDGGTGAGPGVEPDFRYQGTGSNSISRKVGTSLGGFAYTHGSTIDMTAAADSIAMLKGMWANSAALVAAPSAQFKIGSATSAAYRYQMVDEGTRGDITAPPQQLWVVGMINPNIAAWRDFTDGSPSLTTVDVFGIQGDFTSQAKAENVCMDAVDISPGLWLHGSSPDGTFLDFQAHDFDTLNTRIGHIYPIGNTLFLLGAFAIGRNSTPTAVLTVFTDSNRILEFPGGRVDEGDNELLLDLGNASTVINISACVLTGAGRSGIKRWFDSSADEVDGTNEEIDITAHGFLTGDTVLYSDEGGTAVTGLTDATEYFVNAVTADAIALYAMSGGRDDAYQDGTRVGLTAAGTGQQHSLTRTPITMPDITFVGTAGTGTFSGCTFNGINKVTMTSGATIEESVFNGVHLIDMDDNATLSNCTINDPITTEGVAVVNSADPDDISDCVFNASSNGGHAMKVETTGSHTLSNIDFNSYGPNPAEFDGTTDVSTGTNHITFPGGHGYVTGDAAYYNRRGNTALGGVTDQARYYLNVAVNDVSLHNTRADAVANANLVNISSTQTGTHAIESANAAVDNATSGAVTLVVSGGTTPSYRNSVAGGSTTISADVSVTFTPLIDNTEIRVYTAGTTTELAGVENSSGGSEALAVAASTSVDIMIHSLGYETIRFESFTWPSTAQNFPVTQRVDRNYLNP